MPKSIPMILVGVLIIVIILLMMCAFQVKYTETAVVTRFDQIRQVVKPAEAGLQWKFPWPIDQVHRFDARLRSFETEFKQLGTADQKTVVLTAYATWKIDDAEKFLKAVGRDDAAVPKLRDVLENRVSEVLKSHALSELVNTDASKIKFTAVEEEILAGVKQRTLDNYGVRINSVGIKRLNIPEAVTKEVFARMKEDRQKEIIKLQAEGRSEAARITSEAKIIASRIQTRSEEYAKSIESQGKLESVKFYKVFAENRELAEFLKKSETVLKILKSGESTLILPAGEVTPFDEFTKRLGGVGKPGSTAPSRTNDKTPAERSGAAE